MRKKMEGRKSEGWESVPGVTLKLSPEGMPVFARWREGRAPWQQMQSREVARNMGTDEGEPCDRRAVCPLGASKASSLGPERPGSWVR